MKFLAGSKGCAENLLLAECHIFFFFFGHKSVQVFSA